MAGSREYTPQRRRIMQIVMCGVLAVTVGLALLVSRAAGRAAHIELTTKATEIRGISFRLPSKWKTRSRPGDDPRVIAQASETDNQYQRARTLRIIVDHLESPISPMQYLVEQLGVAPPSEPTEESTSNQAEATTLGVAGSPGVCVVEIRAAPDPRRMEEGGAVIKKEIYAASVLPSRQAIVVQLSGEGIPDPTDTAIVAQVAAAIKVAPPQFDQPRSIVTLPLGIELTPPTQFDAVVQSDPNRTDRLLWRQMSVPISGSAEEFEKNWTVIEVVGVLFPPTDPNSAGATDRAAAAIQTILLTRDPNWRNAQVAYADGSWHAQTTDDSPFPTHAYVLPNSSGRALLAIFHGGDPSTLDEIWKNLTQSIKFKASSDIAKLEDVGAAEAARIHKTDLNTLIGDHDDQWWLWTNQSDRPHFGWNSLRWQTGKLAADVEVRLRFPSGAIGKISGQWSIKPDTRNYSAQFTKIETRSGKSASLQQVTALQRNELTITYRPPNNAPETKWTANAPSQYVPGELLPLIVGKLAPEPLLLRSESFIDCPLLGAPEPLTIIFRPGPQTTRKAEGDERPMRVVTAEVNGSGRVSQWYFRNSGELESIELSDGEQRLASDPKSISFDFGKDTRMSP